MVGVDIDGHLLDRALPSHVLIIAMTLLNRIGTRISNALTYSPSSIPSTPTVKQDNFPIQRFVQVGLEGLAERPTPSSEKQGDAEIEAITNSWAYSAIVLITQRLIANKVGMHVKERRGEELIDINNHPFERLLERPNTLMSGDFMRAYTHMWLLLRGEAYVFISTPSPGEGEPEELWPIPANLIEPDPQSLRRARGDSRRLVIDFVYRPSPDNKRIRLPGENVVQFRFPPNPFSYFRGLSPLSAAYLAIRTDKSQGQWLRDWYDKKNAHPSFVAAVPSDVGDVEFEKLREDFFNKFQQGLGTAFTRSGDLDVTVIQQTLEQMKLLDGRDFSKQEIAIIYNIPVALLDKSSSGKDKQALETQLAENALQPRLDIEASFWTTSVVRPYYGDDLLVRAANIIPRDRALAVQEYNTWANDRTIAENRAAQNLKPIPEGASDLLKRFIEQVPVRMYDPLNKAGVLMGVMTDSMEEPPTPEGSERNLTPQVESGNMSGAQAPERTVETEIARSTDLLMLPDPDAAMSEAVRQELLRWRKVAARLLKDKGDPLAREFTSDIIPPPIYENIATKLAGVSHEQAVKDIFGEWLEEYRPASLNGHRSEADVLEAAARNLRESTKAVDQDELDEVFRKYHETVNMSASELKAWADNPCSREASLDRSPIRRNLRLLEKKKGDWTQKDIDDANRTISFVSRMKGNERGREITIEVDGRERSCGSKRDISLRNWAFNPDKKSKSFGGGGFSEKIVAEAS